VVGSLTILKLTPSFGWFSFCSKLTNYNNYLWHHWTNQLFLWNNSKYLKYPIHQPEPYWWWCNSLDILASNCMTFVYTFCYLKSNIKENGYALVILRELCTFIMFYTNCASFRLSSYNLFSNHCGFVLLFVVVLQSPFLTFVVPHV
jgi:hypothetical protein